MGSGVVHESIEGIWTIELYGPFGWENRGVLVFEDGEIVGGGNRHYSFGSYELAGEGVRADLKVHYYGPPRTMFGEAKEEFETTIVGTKKDDEIEGTISRPDKQGFDLQVRLTKRMGLPSA